MRGRISVFIPSSCHIVLVQVESSIASNLLQRISCDCVRRRASCQMYTSASAVVGERSGKSTLYVSNKLNVDHRAYPTEGDARRALQIKMVALHDYFKPRERVDLIKMDIQGYELHA